MSDPNFLPGFEYPRWEIAVEPEQQAEKLTCCDIDPSIYHGRVDATHFAGEAMMATKRAGGSINGGVHAVEVFSLTAPIALQEPIEIRGRIESQEPHPRGSYSTTRFAFFRPDGSCPLSVTRGSLMLDPTAEAVHAKRESRATPAAPILDLQSEHLLVPEKVARYSVEAENLIHSDPAVAREFGYRAPIAGGLLGVRLMMAHLAQRGAIEALEIRVRFRRPIFWDDRLRLFASADLEQSEARLELRRDDDKVATDAVISNVKFA